VKFYIMANVLQFFVHLGTPQIDIYKGTAVPVFNWAYTAVEVQLYILLITALHADDWSALQPSCLRTQQKELEIGSWIDLRDRPGILEKIKVSFPCQILNNDFLVIQHVV
jgi:hypothetical protein